MESSQEKINSRQKEFYQSFKKNSATKFWYAIRNGVLTDFRKTIGIEKDVVEQHYEWIGDLNGKKVLDLGCFKGNSLSIYLAQNSAEYVGIDLSEPAINYLNKRLEKIPNANAYAVDFLSDDFKHEGFDLIYAYGVLHHFKDVDILIERLQEKLSSDGKIISYDPTNTSFPIRLARFIYRPFQTDRDWEWPFSKNTIQKFEKTFNIVDRRGLLGKAKWFFLFNFLPISEIAKNKNGKRWHKEDWEESRTSREKFLNCMQITMCMKKKTTE